jgi:hypothetical protein
MPTRQRIVPTPARKWFHLPKCFAVAALVSIPLAPAALSQTLTGTLEPNVAAVSDGSMSAVARAAMDRGALRLDADKALKAAMNAAGTLAAVGSSNSPAARGSTGPLVPIVKQNIAGQTDAGVTPPDTFGATGTSRYVQVVNRRVGIYNRAGVLINGDTLDSLFGTVANNFDPQVIWDGSTNRFYYAGDMVVSSAENRLAWGFSRSSSPNNATTDWCHYSLNYGSKFPDYPKLGDSRLFTFVGVNNFQPGFVGSDVVAFRKPVGTAVITACPSIGFGIYSNLQDSTGTLVFTPTPGNMIENINNGYSVARTLGLPSTQLIIHAFLGGTSTTFPALQAPRTLNVASYTVPPDAVQSGATQRLDTLDARPWQAIISRNPARGNILTMWTQHTIDGASGATDSDIRYYELRPDIAAPIAVRTGTIGTGNTGNFFNGAISSDRRLNDLTTGDDMVIGYNFSSSTAFPRIVAGSSVAGAALTFQTIRNGLGPYFDFSCAGAGQTCRWGDYASATPDPVPQGGALQAVGLTHQYAGGGASTASATWKTRIYHVDP